jgi:hypothetical protein
MSSDNDNHDGFERDNIVYSRQTLKADNTLIIDGSNGTKFTRVVLIDGQPGIVMENAILNKKIVLTGTVLAGLNGWVAQMFQTKLREVTLN